MTETFHVDLGGHVYFGTADSDHDLYIQLM